MPLRIAIDARHLKDFGIGTYIRNLVRALARTGAEETFVLVARPSDLGDLSGLPKNFEIV